MNRIFVAAVAALALFACVSHNAVAEPKPKLLATEGDWRLVLNGSGGKSCGLYENYRGTKASGFIDLERTPNEIAMVILQLGFSNHSIGWLEFEFDEGGPFKIEVEPVEKTLLPRFEKRMADAFVARFDASKTLSINYPSWPEEYPASLALPSSALKQAWDDCVTKNFPAAASAATTAK